jgi:hypothetical protein
MGISFEQIRTATNPGLEDDGNGALRIKLGFGVQLDANGLKLDADVDAFKQPVRVKSQANVNLTGGSSPDAIDGVTLAVGDRILVASQTTPAQDGLYEMTVNGGGTDDNTWARTADAATSSEAAGWYIPVLEGSTDADKLFRVDADQGGATVGTDGWTVVEIGGSTSTTLAGAGLVANAAALDVNVDDSSIEVATDVVQVKALGITNAMLAGSIANAKLSNSSVTVTAGDGLQNAGAVALGASVTMNIDVSDFAGTGLEDDGSENLRIAAAAAGAGLTGGAGSALAVGAGTGLQVNANDVQVDTGSTVDFSSDTPVWTFGNETTGEGLFVTGTPLDANHVVNKTYVDSLVSGLKWLAPATTLEYVGTRTVAQVNALSPLAGWAVVAGDAGTPTAGTSDALATGDVAVYDGTAWKVSVAQSGGFPPAGTRCVVSGGTLYAPLTDSADEYKIASFSGASLTPTLVSPNDGEALLINGENDANENNGYVYDTNQWVQFTGAGSIIAGNGITKTGNNIAAKGDTTSTGSTASVVAVGSSGIGLRVDNSSLEGSGANGSLRVKSGGVTNAMLAGSILGTKLNANTVALDRLNIRFRRELFAATDFTNTNPSTADLAVPALIGTYEDDYNILSRNGIMDMTNTGNGGSPSGATQYKVDNTGAGSVGKITIGANVNGSGNDYGLQYLSVT